MVMILWAQTWEHLLLHCPRLDEWRCKHPFILSLFSNGLPQCMLQGLMPAMPLNPECIVENDNGTVAITLSSMHEHYSIPLGPQWKHDEAMTCYRHAFLSLGFDTRINARQFLDSMRGMFHIPPTILPSPCLDSPPALPNGFSDGGVINPVFSEFWWGWDVVASKGFSRNTFT